MRVGHQHLRTSRFYTNSGYDSSQRYNTPKVHFIPKILVKHFWESIKALVWGQRTRMHLCKIEQHLCISLGNLLHLIRDGICEPSVFIERIDDCCGPWNDCWNARLRTRYQCDRPVGRMTLVGGWSPGTIVQILGLTCQQVDLTCCKIEILEAPSCHQIGWLGLFVYLSINANITGWCWGEKRWKMVGSLLIATARSLREFLRISWKVSTWFSKSLKIEENPGVFSMVEGLCIFAPLFWKANILTAVTSPSTMVRLLGWIWIERLAHGFQAEVMVVGSVWNMCWSICTSGSLGMSGCLG